MRSIYRPKLWWQCILMKVQVWKLNLLTCGKANKKLNGVLKYLLWGVKRSEDDLLCTRASPSPLLPLSSGFWSDLSTHWMQVMVHSNSEDTSQNLHQQKTQSILYSWTKWRSLCPEITMQSAPGTSVKNQNNILDGTSGILHLVGAWWVPDIIDKNCLVEDSKVL